MKKFVSELKGKTVMTVDGMILGMIDNFVIDTETGDIQHMLVVPAEDLETRMFQTDAQGRLIIPFRSMKSVKDVVVVELK